LVGDGTSLKKGGLDEKKSTTSTRRKRGEEKKNTVTEKVKPVSGGRE